MLDIRTGAFAVEGEAVPDDLDDFAVDALRESGCRLARGKITAVLDSAFDELVGFKRLFGLFDETVGDIGAADIDNGAEMVR